MFKTSTSTGVPPNPGLRERKKQQTRTRIVEVALDLCDEQGFENTTVEQIANAADVSPRTINRYFDTKEDIVLGPTEDFGEAAAQALREQPHTGDELAAMHKAFLQVIDHAPSDEGLLSFRRFQQMQRIAHNSEAVNARITEYDQKKTMAITKVLAERLELAEDSLAVRLLVGTFHMLSHVAMETSDELLLYGDPETAAASCRSGFLTAFNEFTRVIRRCC